MREHRINEFVAWIDENPGAASDPANLVQFEDMTPYELKEGMRRVRNMTARLHAKAKSMGRGKGR